VSAALLAGALPDPGSPSVIPLAAVLGGFVGAAWARVRRRPREEVRRWAEDTAFALTGMAAVAYLTGLASGLY